MISYIPPPIFIFAIVLLAIASYFDIKTREVPDFISYLLVMGGALLSVLSAVTSGSIAPVEFIPVSLTLLFGFSYLMYSLGQWAGGDVKLMLGLAFVFTAFDVSSTSSFISLFINVLVFGGLYGLLGTIVYGALKAQSLRSKLRYYDAIIIAVGAASVVLLFEYLPAPLNYLLAFEAFLFVSMRYIYIIANEMMFAKVHVNKLTEGDWLAKDVYSSDGKLLVRKRNVGLVQEDINKLKEHHVRDVLVRIGLPFVPGIFLGVLVTVFLGNPLLTIIPAAL